MSINYDEITFTMPFQANWDHVHKSINHILFKDSKKAPFIYNVLSHRALGNDVLVTVRGEKLSGVPADTLTLNHSQDDDIDIVIDLCNIVSRENRRKEVLRPPYDDWLSSVLKRAGLKINEFEFIERPNRHVSKSASSFFIPYKTFIANVTIIDLNLFTKAWICGIGKRKGYGLGLIKLKDDL